MTSAVGRIRRRVLTPNVRQTRLDVRGFEPASPSAGRVLETVGETFLLGYSHAMAVRAPSEVEPPLEEVTRRYRGFAYEGAAMAFAVRDCLSFGRRRGVSAFLAGRGGAHVYMAYIGIGWAMARLPGVLRPAAGASDELLRWLVLDGYGFHQAYFHTARYVGRQARDPESRWPARFDSWYAQHAVDQGIGRALWFVNGTDVERTVVAVRGFAPERQADLFSGVGLAATYAGGAGPEGLSRLRTLAGEHRPAVAQGSAFAAESRARAGLVIGETEVATGVLTGMTVEQAAAVALETRPATAVDGELPAYEVWRRATAERLASLSPRRA